MSVAVKEQSRAWSFWLFVGFLITSFETSYSVECDSILGTEVGRATNGSCEHRIERPLALQTDSRGSSLRGHRLCPSDHLPLLAQSEYGSSSSHRTTPCATVSSKCRVQNSIDDSLCLRGLLTMFHTQCINTSIYVCFLLFLFNFSDYRIIADNLINDAMEMMWLVDTSNLLMNINALIVPLIAFIFTRGFRVSETVFSHT